MNEEYRSILVMLEEEGKNLGLMDFAAIRNGVPLPPDSAWREDDAKIRRLRDFANALLAMKEKEVACDKRAHRTA